MPFHNPFAEPAIEALARPASALGTRRPGARRRLRARRAADPDRGAHRRRRPRRRRERGADRRRPRAGGGAGAGRAPRVRGSRRGDDGGACRDLRRGRVRRLEPRARRPRARRSPVCAISSARAATSCSARATGSTSPGASCSSCSAPRATSSRRLPELLEAGAGHGLELVYAATASDEDWRRYEWAYVFNLDRYIRDHPGEEGLDELVQRLDRIRRRRLLAARDGEALGFALVAWRKP